MLNHFKNNLPKPVRAQHLPPDWLRRLAAPGVLPAMLSGDGCMGIHYRAGRSTPYFEWCQRKCPITVAAINAGLVPGLQLSGNAAASAHTGKLKIEQKDDVRRVVAYLNQHLSALIMRQARFRAFCHFFPGITLPPGSPQPTSVHGDLRLVWQRWKQNIPAALQALVQPWDM
jgi:hypothetical protein